MTAISIGPPYAGAKWADFMVSIVGQMLPQIQQAFRVVPAQTGEPW